MTGAVDRSTNAMVDFSSGVLTKSICAQLPNRGCLHMTQKMLAHRSRPNLLIQTIRHTWTEFKALDGEMDLRWTKPKPPLKELKMTDDRFIGYTYKGTHLL